MTLCQQVHIIISNYQLLVWTERQEAKDSALFHLNEIVRCMWSASHLQCLGKDGQWDFSRCRWSSGLHVNLSAHVKFLMISTDYFWVLCFDYMSCGEFIFICMLFSWFVRCLIEPSVRLWLLGHELVMLVARRQQPDASTQLEISSSPSI